MTPYRQTAYPNVKLGFSSTYTIAQAGCALVSCAIMANTDPVTANNRIKAAGGFQGASIIWAIAARTLGLKYNGVGIAPQYPCIGCTDHYKAQGYPTHFFVIQDPNTIIDPLDGRVKSINTYRITKCEYVQPTNALTMDQLARLQQLESFVARLQAGCINEFIKPDGSIIQEVHYTQWTDYHDVMGRDPKFLIQVAPNFEDQVRALRTGGFQP